MDCWITAFNYSEVKQELLKKTFSKISPSITLFFTKDESELMSLLRKNSSRQKRGLILLDVQAGRFDSLNVLRKIRESEINHIPVIFLTDSARQNEINDAYGAGAGGFILMPFDNEALVGVVKESLTFWLNGAVNPNYLK